MADPGRGSRKTLIHDGVVSGRKWLILAAAHSGRAPRESRGQGKLYPHKPNNESKDSARVKIYERMFEREDRETNRIRQIPFGTPSGPAANTQSPRRLLKPRVQRERGSGIS